MKKILISLLIAFTVFFSFPIEAYASGSLDALECPDPNENYGVSSDRYLVWYDYTTSNYYVWFMSKYYYFYFVDGDTTKTFNARDMYGAFYTLNSSFDEYTSCSLTLADVYNNNSADILFIYSTHDLYTKSNTSGDVFLHAGFQDGYTQEDTETDDTLDEETEGWLSSIFGGIGDIVDGIKKLGSNLQSWLLSLGTSIISGISDFFEGLVFPEDGYLDTKKTEIENAFSNLLGFQVSSVEALFNSSNVNETTLVEKNYNITFGKYTFSFTPYDNDILLEGINTFKPIIRGFVALMLVFFNMNQLLNVIGQGSITQMIGFSNKQANGGKE